VKTCFGWLRKPASVCEHFRRPNASAAVHAVAGKQELIAMSQPRLDGLIAKLQKGHLKTREFFDNLTPEQWQLTVYDEPDWTAHNLLAHFVSAEQHLLGLSQNVAANGSGAPEGFDINRFNAKEQNRLQGKPIRELLDALDQSRQRTIDWVRTLGDEQLDKKGRHPALGEVSVEAILIAIYGHQILHMRDLVRLHRAKTA
jgi:hypothetical protein